jgi:hypothetical protein
VAEGAQELAVRGRLAAVVMRGLQGLEAQRSASSSVQRWRHQRCRELIFLFSGSQIRDAPSCSSPIIL